MSVLVAKPAPDFSAQTVWPDDSFAELKFSSYRGKYVVLFFYPLDFTFVCPTEIVAFDKAIKEFEKRNAAVIGVSVDSHFTHLAWRQTPRNKGGIGSISYPLVSDLDKNIARAYDVLLKDSIALRGLFLIDPKGVVRHQVVNDLPLGRSVPEVLRMIDALHFAETHGEVCPANWQEGHEALAPTAGGIAAYMAKHHA
jgi:peroxiredoxin (alkyl hydroperoxide reductase subunit C)